MSKNKIYLIIIIILLLVIGFTWYVKSSSAEKTFTYQNSAYACQETEEAATDSSTAIKIIPSGDGTLVITHEGKQYLCRVSTQTTQMAKAVALDDAKIFLSDAQGTDVEVADGKIQVGATGDVVVVDSKGVTVQAENGNLVEVNEQGVKVRDRERSIEVNNDGSVDIQTPEGSVKTDAAGNANITSPQGTVKTQGDKIDVTAPGTGGVSVDSNSVEVPDAGVDISY